MKTLKQTMSCLVILAMFLPLCSNSFAGIVDLTNFPSNLNVVGFGFGNSTSTYEVKRYQTFITSNYSMTGVDLKLRKINGTNHSDITVELMETINNVPIGTALASSVIPQNAIKTSWDIYNVPLFYKGFQYNKKYALVLGQKTPGSSMYEWAAYEQNGNLQSGYYNGSQYIDESVVGDFWMKLYGFYSDRFCSANGVDVVNPAASPSAYSFGSYGDAQFRYQTFKTPNYIFDNKVSGVDLKIRKKASSGSSQTDVSVWLYNVTNGKPTGSPLCQRFIPQYMIGTEWTIVHADILCNVNNGTEYAIVLGQKDAVTSSYEWAVSPVDPSLKFGKTYISWEDQSHLGDGWMKVWIGMDNQQITFIPPISTTKSFGLNSPFQMPIRPSSIQPISPSAPLIGKEILEKESPLGAPIRIKSYETRRYQTFTTGNNDYNGYDLGYNLEAIDLMLVKGIGNSQSDIVVEIYPVNENKPSGAPIAESIIPAYLVGKEYTSVRTRIDCTLSSNTKYAVVLRQRNPSTSMMEWAFGWNSAGEAFGIYNSNSGWSVDNERGSGWIKAYITAPYWEG